MLLYLPPYERWIEEAETALKQRGRCSAAIAEAIIGELAHAEGLEKQIVECERQARLYQIKPRDSVIGAVLRLIDAYAALIECGEKAAGQRLDVPRTILERRGYWEDENDPLKLYVPGTTFGS